MEEDSSKHSSVFQSRNIHFENNPKLWYYLRAEMIRKGMEKLNKMKQQNTFTLAKDESNIEDSDDHWNSDDYAAHNTVSNHKLKPRESPFYNNQKHNPYKTVDSKREHSPEFGTPSEKNSAIDYFKNK